METLVKNRTESLRETIDRAAYGTALLAGRRLFECGHFALAPLSAAQSLPKSEACEIVSLSEARRLLPGALLSESETLAALFAVHSRVAAFGRSLREHLTYLATSELNHIQSEPTTAGLAVACLAYLEALPKADPHPFEQVRAAWQERFTRALQAQHCSPVDLSGFLSEGDRARLAGLALVHAGLIEGLLRALAHFGERRLLQTPPPPPRSAQDDLEEYEGLHAARARFLASTLALHRAADLAEAHHALLEGNIADACVRLDERAALAERALEELAHMERRSGLHVLRERNLVLENFHYVRALGRQLGLLGAEAGDARALEKALFRYANAHGSAAAEILDDEIARLTPRVSRDAIAVARLRVRHDDTGYPLSVAHRETVVKIVGEATLLGDTRAEPQPVAAAGLASSSSSSGAAS